jgi:hypothetical protein
VVGVTASARLLGRRGDGSVRRYGIEGPARTLHILATRTGALAYCGFRPTAVVSPPLARARAIEQATDPQARGLLRCRTCFAALTPQPDPSIWRPR